MFTVKVDDSSRASVARLCSELEKIARSAISARGAFNLALSGGNTANEIFEVLRNSDIEWGSVRFFWVDERCVFPDDPASNYGQAEKNFFSRIDARGAGIFRLRGEECPVLECERYSRLVELIVKERFNGTPAFDCAILGVGADAHTASIFPHSKELLTDKRLYCAGTDPTRKFWRMTMTGRTILAAERILVAAYGEQKACALKSILRGALPIEVSTPAGYVLARARNAEIFTDVEVS